MKNNWTIKKLHQHLKRISVLGGLASASNLTKEQRVERAKKAALTRWRKPATITSNITRD